MKYCSCSTVETGRNFIRHEAGVAERVEAKYLQDLEGNSRALLNCTYLNLNRVTYVWVWVWFGVWSRHPLVWFWLVIRSESVRTQGDRDHECFEISIRILQFVMSFWLLSPLQQFACSMSWNRLRTIQRMAWHDRISTKTEIKLCIYM